MATLVQTRAMPILEARNLSKSFETPGGRGSYTVLSDVTFRLLEGEFVAILGRSGSGKSTLLRILAGLLPASLGEVLSEGKPLRGPNPDVAMVFQSFALLPWLTVQENVELGLKARGVGASERRKHALKAIDMVGLDGFESAYPKELSGGMKQRVGFARAFVMRPKALFMDEPFSALDVLTAENLRSEIGDLWEAGDFVAKSVLMVTHNIEEAVLLADRVVILGSNPGHIRGEVPIKLRRPRERNSAVFRELVKAIYRIMTVPELSVREVLHELRTGESVPVGPLPHARAGAIGGLLQMVDERGGSVSAADLSQALQIPIDDLFEIVDAAVLLGFADTGEGLITIKEEGRALAEAEILESKAVFRNQVLAHVPMLRTLTETLQAKRDRSMDADDVLDMLDEHFPREESERQFETAVDWARFGELFEYDSNGHTLYLPEAVEGEAELSEA